jgi:ketosteroid isomerase-like protein
MARIVFLHFIKDIAKGKMGTLVLGWRKNGKAFKKILLCHRIFSCRAIPDGKTINGRYSSLMKKIKGKWYLYTDHSG